MPEKPLVTARFWLKPQFLHSTCRLVALLLSVLAPMTMPGIRTRWLTLVAVKPRIEVCETEEWMRSWWSGSALAASRSVVLRDG